MKRVILWALLAFVGGHAFASIGQGTIAKVESGPIYGDKVFITIEGSVTGQPACWASGNYHFVFDSTAPGGKNLLASIMLAKASKQSIVIAGNGVCSLYGGVEDLRWFRIE